MRFPALGAGFFIRSVSLVAAAGALVLVLLIPLALGRGVPERLASPSMSLGRAPATGSSLAPAAKESSAPAAKAHGRLPLSFIKNEGQVDRQVSYYARASGASFYFTNNKAVFAFTKGKKGVALDLTFRGANPNARLEVRRNLPGKVNYLTAASHHTSIPTYRELVYRNLWPGIDMVFRGKGTKLKYEFLVSAGANANDIRLAYRGADDLRLGAAGALLIDTPLGTLKDSPPRSYQRIRGRRLPIESRYASVGQAAYGFHVGGYDESRPLVIDPGLVYSTFLGGSGYDAGHDVAVDSQGAAYVTGRADSADFPTTPGAFDTTKNGPGDVFVTKLAPSGSSLVYSTFLGSGIGHGIAVDSGGSAYVTGYTDSPTFPTTPGAYDRRLGGQDAFITKLDPTGSSLVYSTYLGGSKPKQGGDFEEGDDIAVDAQGMAYVVGSTTKSDFPTTPKAYQRTGTGVFVTKLNSAGSDLVYSTLLGGILFERGGGIALDAQGNAYVTGVAPDGFPTTAGAYDTTFNGQDDVFVTKLNATGSGLVYSTYLGGTSPERSGDIAVDATGNAYAIGETSSSDFPTTIGAYDRTVAVDDAFVTKLNPAGSALVYSTYLGGSGLETGDFNDIALGGDGAAYVTGRTSSTDFPTTPGAFDTVFEDGFCFSGPCVDAFMTKLDPSGSALEYSTYLGGAGDDEGFGIAVDGSGDSYVTGHACSSDFPTTAGAFDTSPNGNCDGFVTKLLMPEP